MKKRKAVPVSAQVPADDRQLGLFFPRPRPPIYPPYYYPYPYYPPYYYPPYYLPFPFPFFGGFGRPPYGRPPYGYGYDNEYRNNNNSSSESTQGR
ncbi:hypothetical protein [Ammoniphilus sp. 3BR4]|uniref:hypothetical protein n=1 Tax=Ammoniphilus sp. 3BR4 TaxID=3158265 RepID=UPI0034679208